jgi:ribosomal protein S6
MKGNTYQLVVVLNPKLEEKTKSNVLKSLEGWIAEAGGKTKKPKDLGNKELEYAMSGCRSGDFWEFTIESDGVWKSKDFNLYLNRENSIIRYIVLKK